MVSKQQDDIKSMQMLHLRIDDIQEIILEVGVFCFCCSCSGDFDARSALSEYSVQNQTSTRALRLVDSHLPVCPFSFPDID